MKRHTWATMAVLCSALTCGGTFLLALYRQLALVEVAASITLGIELYLLSSTVGDWIEEKEAPDKARKWIAIGLAAGVVGYFLVAKSWVAAGGL